MATVAVLASRQGELVVARAEIDRGVGDRGGEGDGVVAGAAGDGLDVGDGGGVGAVPRVRVSVPAPRSIGAVAMAAPRVMMSAPVPPVRVSTLLRVAVLPPLARVSLSAPAPRSTACAVVSAVPRVMVSAPVPPVTVSTLATVAVLAKLPKVSVSLPAPRSMEALAAAATG